MSENDRQPFLLGIFTSISRLFPQPLSSLKDKNFSVALMGEDMDKEMHAVSVACCRERPLSSSHFRVSEQQRNDCLFSLLLLLERAVDFLRATETRLFSSVLFTASLLSEESAVPPIYCPLYLATCTAALKTCIWAILADATVRTVDA